MWSEGPARHYRDTVVRRNWAVFCRTWSFITIAECLRHNLMVVSHAPTEGARLDAAREVSHTITAGLVVLWQELAT